VRVILFLFFSTCSWFALATNPKVAIIIDDIGYRATDSGVLSLPGDITLSILPHTPYGKKLAKKANETNLDIMLHIPMEAENGKRLGPGGLTSKMNRDTINHHLTAAFEEIPFAIGINNHMGSLLTQMETPMTWVMSFLKKRNVIFIDSVTSSESKAQSIAKDYGVPSLHRHIFLDNNLNHSYISKQFGLLIATAKKNKIAVAIAHPHPETIRSLKTLIPLLAQHNISLVSATKLVSHQQQELAFTATSE
jgi:polysaccharide deacetylase 2 family uncharacterized protein YibQ